MHGFRKCQFDMGARRYPNGVSSMYIINSTTDTRVDGFAYMEATPPFAFF